MKKIFFACSIKQIILFTISFLLLSSFITLSIFKREFYFIMLCFVPILWIIFIFHETSLCVLKDEVLYVKADDTSLMEEHQAQKKLP